ncbi:MAG TPA: amylo-alpha-1,6-glucosidase [Polyangiaceae bacterium]|jgi:predicted glycogen debranching enzyme|nr:amylo-alpha-1,6-glucosidase [Polyangiaceae bacterium]
MIQQVWPSVETRGELELAEAEWLHTNGAGAYAMSTLAVMHTRRFHGLFVAALNPPLDRYVVVSHGETTVDVGKRIYRLSTHQFPDIAPTPGYRLLESFAQDPLPRWTYRLGKHRLERRLALARGRNALVMEYTWYGKSTVTLNLRPLMPMRPIHSLRSEQAGVAQKASMRKGEVYVQPVPSLPKVIFGYPGTFVGSPDWWRRFEYAEDRRRAVHYQEDMWTPGIFELQLEPGVPNYLSVSLGESLGEEPAAVLEATAKALSALDPGPERPIAVRALSVAAEQFRVPLCARPSVLAGYPWLGVRSRDALVSLPGLYLTKNLNEEAKGVLRTLFRHRVDDFLASHIEEADTPVPEACVDASLWAFDAVRLLHAKLELNDPFMAEEALPVLEQLFTRFTQQTQRLAWVSDEGLLVTRSEREPLTWMDSRSRGELVTPRRGFAVELQALWSRACDTLALLARTHGNPLLEAQATAARERVRAAFLRHFWCAETRYPYDCIDDLDGTKDDALRPNAVLALALDPDLFEGWQAYNIVIKSRDRLLTSRGLRTLDPADTHYAGYYEGGMEERRAAYHQGAVWGYLLGAWARAAVRCAPTDFDLQMEVRDRVQRAMENGRVIGQVAQVASGDDPQEAGGCPAQAWSVAELLRTLEEELGL